MPATGRELLVELRAAGFRVTIGPDKLRVVDPPGKVAMWRPTFDVEPSGRLTDAQRDDLKKNRISVRRALEMEFLEQRIWDPADGPDPDGMFKRWKEQRTVAADPGADRVPDDFTLEPPPRGPSPPGRCGSFSSLGRIMAIRASEPGDVRC